MVPALATCRRRLSSTRIQQRQIVAAGGSCGGQVHQASLKGVPQVDTQACDCQAADLTGRPDRRSSMAEDAALAHPTGGFPPVKPRATAASDEHKHRAGGGIAGGVVRPISHCTPLSAEIIWPERQNGRLVAGCFWRQSCGEQDRQASATRERRLQPSMSHLRQDLNWLRMVAGCPRDHSVRVSRRIHTRRGETYWPDAPIHGHGRHQVTGQGVVNSKHSSWRPSPTPATVP